MRWPAIIIAAVLICVLQTTIAPRLAIRSVAPDWILLFVVFLALHMRGLDAVLAAWSIGLLADFQSLHRFGVLAMGYGVIGMIIYLLRGMMFPRHVGTLFTMVLLTGTLLHGTIAVTSQLTADVHQDYGGMLMMATSIALYSAVWSLPLNGMLLRFLPLLGVSRPQYTHSGFSRVTDGIR